MFQKISIKEIDEEINRLSIKKARGDDNIGNKVIKSLKEYLLPILHHLFNVSLYIGYIPEIWKTAKLIMIFKENKPKNYHGNMYFYVKLKISPKCKCNRITKKGRTSQS